MAYSIYITLQSGHAELNTNSKCIITSSCVSSNY